MRATKEVNLLLEVEDQVEFAKGIKSAVIGLECLSESLQNGVVSLLDVHIDRLEWIMDMIVEEAKRERKSVAVVPAA
jgi:hypothetical protein